MVNTLVWKDAKSFQRHLDSMTTFRQSHQHDPEHEPALLKDLPAQGDTFFPVAAGGARGFISSRGKPAVFPIWEIALPRNSQN